MSCLGPITPGNDFTSEPFKANGPDQIGIYVNGVFVGGSVQSVGDGEYIAKLEGSKVECPGPLVIKDGETQVACYDIAPCP